MSKLFLKIFVLLSLIKFSICYVSLTNISSKYIFQLVFVNLIVSKVLSKRYKTKNFKINILFLVLLSFVIFFYLINEIVFLDPVLVEFRRWHMNWGWIQNNLYWYNWHFLLYFLVFNLGLSIRFRLNWLKFKRFEINPLSVGVIFTLLGLTGSVLSVGGLNEYIGLVGRFYVRSDAYVETVENLNSSVSLLLILRSFLIPGALILFHVWNMDDLKLNSLKALIVFSFLLFFGGVTGQRSVYFGFIIYIYLYKLFISGQLFYYRNLLLSTIFFFIVTLNAVLRDHLYLDYLLLKDLWNYALIHSGANYLTNFSGIYTLVEYYKINSHFKADTILNQILGVFGGPTPLTTEALMWQELSSNQSSVPRYGMWFEFFMNFGYISFILALIHGYVIGIITRTVIFMRDNIYSVVYNSLVLYLVVVLTYANWSYIPRQFFFLSFPIFILFTLSRLQNKLDR